MSKGMSNRLALFDCDGTLVDSQAAICASMEEAFRAVGRTAPDRHAIRRIVGLSLFEAMRVLEPEEGEALHIALVDGYKHAFRTLRLNGLLEEPLFDGIAPLLTKLDAAGWLLGIATGKSDRGLKHMVEAHGLSGLFVTLQTADRHPSKPHPAMAEAAMAEAGAQPETSVVIGDTSYDIRMARDAGAKALGVGWGYHDPAELIAAGAHRIANRPEDIETSWRTCYERRSRKITLFHHIDRPADGRDHGHRRPVHLPRLDRRAQKRGCRADPARFRRLRVHSALPLVAMAHPR